MIVALNFSFLCHDICFQSFFPSLRQTFIQRMWVTRLTQCWKMVFFLQSYRLEDLSQAFLIHFTFYLYLGWSSYMWVRVSRVIYVFPKVSSLDEKSVGKIVLMSFLWKCKWKSFDLRRLTFHFVVCFTCTYFLFYVELFWSKKIK